MCQILQLTGLRSGPFSGHKSGSLYGDHDLLNYCTFGVEAANDAQNVKEHTTCRNGDDQNNLPKMIL